MSFQQFFVLQTVVDFDQRLLETNEDQSDDPSCVAEFKPILDETVRQFKSLLLEISR